MKKSRLNIDTDKLANLGLTPGPWLQKVKNLNLQEQIEIQNQIFDLEQLRNLLLHETAGDSIAYCTDFLLNDTAMKRLVPALKGVTTLICESQYRVEDAHLAAENYHMTATGAAELAQQAEVGQLILFHISDRYDALGRAELLREAQSIF